MVTYSTLLLDGVWETLVCLAFSNAKVNTLVKGGVASKAGEFRTQSGG